MAVPCTWLRGCSFFEEGPTCYKVLCLSLFPGCSENIHLCKSSDTEKHTTITAICLQLAQHAVFSPHSRSVSIFDRAFSGFNDCNILMSVAPFQQVKRPQTTMLIPVYWNQQQLHCRQVSQAWKVVKIWEKLVCNGGGPLLSRDLEWV